jgi:hypothetical protein
VSDTEALFGVLRQSADASCAAAIEGAVANAPDHELCRVNALAFATKNKLDEERTIAAFLHAARLGVFELSWNIVCPACGGVLEAGTTLKTEATLDMFIPAQLKRGNATAQRNKKLQAKRWPLVTE